MKTKILSIQYSTRKCLNKLRHTRVRKNRELCWTLIFTLRIFTRCELFARIRHILVCVKYMYDQFWDFNVRIFHNYLILNVWRIRTYLLHLWRIRSIFSRVTNTCEFFRRVIDSFECECQTNLSQVRKIRTYLSHLWRTRMNFPHL